MDSPGTFSKGVRTILLEYVILGQVCDSIPQPCGGSAVSSHTDDANAIPTGAPAQPYRMML